jgi:hypothetical protein
MPSYKTIRVQKSFCLLADRVRIRHYKTLHQFPSEVSPRTPVQEMPLPLALPEGPPHLSAVIQPLRLRLRNGQANLHLLALVAQHTLADADTVGLKTERENHAAQQEKPSPMVYPVVTGVSAEKVRQLIDASLRGTKWRDMPGNYSQTIKPVREAWERIQATIV